MKRIILVLFLFFAAYTGFGQRGFNSVGQLTELVDTSKVGLASIHLHYRWMNDTIEICRRIEPVNIDTFNQLRVSPAIKIESAKDSATFIETLRKIYRWNCLVYATAKYLERQHIRPAPIFGEPISLDAVTMQTILSSAFVQTFRFRTDSRKSFRQEMPLDDLIVFRNHAGDVTHALIYQEGKFYSKNGTYNDLKVYSNLYQVYKVYKETGLVEFYQLDKDKINQFLATN